MPRRSDFVDFIAGCVLCPEPRVAFFAPRRGGMAPGCSEPASSNIPSVRLTTFGIALMAPASLISPGCSGVAAPSVSARI